MQILQLYILMLSPKLKMRRPILVSNLQLASNSEKILK